MTGNQGNRITSTERFQNNNISSANPKKAMVTPRQGQLKAFKGNAPQISTGSDMLQALQQQDAGVTGPQAHSTSNQQNIFQKNLTHQINTQRANHNP